MAEIGLFSRAKNADRSACRTSTTRRAAPSSAFGGAAVDVRLE